MQTILLLRMLSVIAIFMLIMIDFSEDDEVCDVATARDFPELYSGRRNSGN